MLVGLAFDAAIRDRRPNLSLRLLTGTLGGKLLLWPLVAMFVLWLDGRRATPWLGSPASSVLGRGFLFVAFMPLAANTVAYAQELDAEPEQAALLVLISTLLALAWIPLAVAGLHAMS